MREGRRSSGLVAEEAALEAPSAVVKAGEKTDTVGVGAQVKAEAAEMCDEEAVTGTWGASGGMPLDSEGLGKSHTTLRWEDGEGLRS